MLREFQVTKDKPANSMYKSGEEKIVTGMAVVKNESNKTFEFASAETAADLFFVDKERVPSGINAARGDMSDYDEDFVNIKAGEFIGLERYTDGEKFATDQFKAGDFGEGAVAGIDVSVGVDGKWQKATVSTMPSKYVFDGFHNDNGHKLVMVRVEADAIKNA